MTSNPNQPSRNPDDFEPASNPKGEEPGGLRSPRLAHTANGNLEAHSAVTWLESNGVNAYAVEDNSGVSLFALGTISQFHKPQVFVDESDLNRTRVLMQQFELQRDLRRTELKSAPPIKSICEECGAESEFPTTQDGTTQNCPKCRAFMDVGSLGWAEDFDFGEDQESPPTIESIDDAMDIAVQLEKSGEWELAIDAYREIIRRWPEHSVYATNCIAGVQRLIDAAK